MKTDLLLSVVKDRRWTDIDCYALSAARTFQGRKVMIVENVEDRALTNLRQLGFEVYPQKTTIQGLHFQSSRFFIAANFLGDHREQFENVVWTDVCDVVFQRDPVKSMLEAIGTFQLLAVKEGWVIKNQAINDVWIKRLGLSPSEYASLREQEVLCSGTIAGKSEAMLYLFVEMCSRMRDEMQGADQGVFNWIVRTTSFNSITKIAEPDEAFATTLGIFLAPSDPTIWTIKQPALYWTGSDRGLVYSPDGRKLYSIMHQYNRAYGPLDPTGCWRDAVERRYRV